MESGGSSPFTAPVCRLLSGSCHALMSPWVALPSSTEPQRPEGSKRIWMRVQRVAYRPFRPLTDIRSQRFERVLCGRRGVWNTVKEWRSKCAIRGWPATVIESVQLLPHQMQMCPAPAPERWIAFSSYRVCPCPNLKPWLLHAISPKIEIFLRGCHCYQPTVPAHETCKSSRGTSCVQCMA